MHKKISISLHGQSKIDINQYHLFKVCKKTTNYKSVHGDKLKNHCKQIGVINIYKFYI